MHHIQLTGESCQQKHWHKEFADALKSVDERGARVYRTFCPSILGDACFITTSKDIHLLIGSLETRDGGPGLIVLYDFLHCAFKEAGKDELLVTLNLGNEHRKRAGLFVTRAKDAEGTAEYYLFPAN